MNKLSKISYLLAVLLLLVLVLAGCTSSINEESKEDSSETSAASASDRLNEEAEENKQPDKTDDNSKSVGELSASASNISEETPPDVPETEEPNQSSEETTTSNDSPDTYVSEEDDPLARYSTEEVEYARVWLQLGPNQQIDGLYVRHIPAGTTLEPDYFPIVSYPEDVVQLSGSRIVDGSVTYSSNGDGSINVYNVPLPGRWYGGSPTPPEGVDEDTMREELEDIINNTELVYVNPGNDEAVKKLIELISN
ncbi:hypothetical protein [Terribacillus saccharophilus]|uniref:Lipoprotein n=1 Tax=Terribacillus saccharophilus TaxID=361277 RepID=A0A268A9S6_9BACI|nr:hypothetical protein [Terribacillus saccharophilus]PAD20874.1 hypothetical protein CHH64_11885 [Terribacillus saccharophilus]